MPGVASTDPSPPDCCSQSCCNETPSLMCLDCLKAGLEKEALLCSAECFKRHWLSHRVQTKRVVVASSISIEATSAAARQPAPPPPPGPAPLPSSAPGQLSSPAPAPTASRTIYHAPSPRSSPPRLGQASSQPRTMYPGRLHMPDGLASPVVHGFCPAVSGLPAHQPYQQVLAGTPYFRW